MPGEIFFMTMGGLGVSLAGFAGLISALDRSPTAHSAVASYRIRGIVVLGFAVTFIAFGTIAFFTLSGENVSLTVRVSSLLIAIPHLRGLRVARPGPLWTNETERRIQIAILLVLIAVTLGNVVVASVGYLELLFILLLGGPVSIFYNTVRDMGLAQAAVTEPDPTQADA